MSYDIDFRVRLKDIDKQISCWNCDANVTWNVVTMIRESTGLEWLNEEDNGLCIDIMPKIQAGLSELMQRPEIYKQYEAPNGWGTVDGCVRFFNWVLREWNEFVEAEPELAPIARFWIY